MRLTTLLIAITLSLFTSMALFGHGEGHSYTPVDQETAQANAVKIVAALVKRNKLEESWASVTTSSVEKRITNDNPEWVAVFVNDKIADPAKQKLYVFLTLGGDYIAANHTGN